MTKLLEQLVELHAPEETKRVLKLARELRQKRLELHGQEKELAREILTASKLQKQYGAHAVAKSHYVERVERQMAEMSTVGIVE